VLFALELEGREKRGLGVFDFFSSFFPFFFFVRFVLRGDLVFGTSTGIVIRVFYCARDMASYPSGGGGS